MELGVVVADIATAVLQVDKSHTAFRGFTAELDPMASRSSSNGSLLTSTLCRRTRDARERREHLTFLFRALGQSNSKLSGHTATTAMRRRIGRSIECTGILATSVRSETALSSSANRGS